MDLAAGGRGQRRQGADRQTGDWRDGARHPRPPGHPLAARHALAGQPRPGVCAKKRQRDRLIRLAEAHPDWALGFADETWWSRVATPDLHAWAEPQRPLRLVEQAVAKDDPDPKALAAYGLYLPAASEMLLRFVDGRPVSALTTRFLAWCCERLAARGTAALLLVWDNASWHISREVRAWVREHNRSVKRGEAAVRLVICQLPVQSPWLNPIEPKWAHGKRRAVEPDRLLIGPEIAERACAALGCAYEDHLSLSKQIV